VDVDIGSIGGATLAIASMLIALAAPVAVVVVLLWLARRRFMGRRGRFDGLFGGIGRANAMNSHLQAGTPDPDDLAVPSAPMPLGRRSRKGRR